MTFLKRKRVKGLKVAAGNPDRVPGLADKEGKVYWFTFVHNT